MLKRDLIDCKGMGWHSLVSFWIFGAFDGCQKCSNFRQNASSALKVIALSQDFAAAELDGLERGLKVQSFESQRF